MSRNPPAPEWVKWLRAWAKNNGESLAPLTGTDFRALAAIAALWELYSMERHARVLDAVRIALGEMQPSTRHFARPLIARAMDWSDQDKLWPLVDVNADRGAA